MFEAIVSQGQQILPLEKITFGNPLPPIIRHDEIGVLRAIGMTIYFYKVSEPYGCFSNFSPHSIHLSGRDWQTVEHFYQAHKFLGTADEPLMVAIRKAPTPEEAAQLGRDLARTCRRDWHRVKTVVMREAVLTKFLTHEDIQQTLLATGDESIVEDSARDYFWGCGLDKTGQNHLGKILMSVREEIRHRSRSK